MRHRSVRCEEGIQTPGGFARGGTVFRGLQPSEARLRPSGRAKRGRPAEQSEAPPSRSEAFPAAERRSEAPSTEAPPSEPRLRRAKRGRAKVIGRSPLQKNSKTTKRFHQKLQKAQGNHLYSGHFGPLARKKKKIRARVLSPNQPVAFYS